jgi:alkylated DNA repair dioxygenase AlkB
VAEGLFPPKRGQIRVFGKTYEVPRDQVGMGCMEVGYKYSGGTVEQLPWNEEVKKIKQYVEEKTRCHFNYCLINGYGPGDKVSYHQDNERNIDQKKPIVSVSFGVTRKFVMASSVNGKIEKGKGSKLEYELQCGDILVMRPGCQGPNGFFHAVPASKRSTGRRYNITFRVLKA